MCCLMARPLSFQGASGASQLCGQPHGLLLALQLFSWPFRSEFGPRVLPTMKRAVPKAVGDVPVGPIEESRLHDKDAEDVIQHAEAEQRTHEEQSAMASQDPLLLVLEQSKEPADGERVTVFDDAVSGSEMPNAAMTVEAPAGSALSTGQTGAVELEDPGLAVPVTSPRDFVAMSDSPRASASARPRTFDDEETAKKQKTEDAKRQRINRWKMEYEKRLREVKLAYKEYFTVDDYTTDLDLQDDSNDDDDDVWAGEDDVKLHGIPLELWSDDPLDQTPKTPEKWID